MVAKQCQRADALTQTEFVDAAGALRRASKVDKRLSGDVGGPRVRMNIEGSRRRDMQSIVPHAAGRAGAKRRQRADSAAEEADARSPFTSHRNLPLLVKATLADPALA